MGPVLRLPTAVGVVGVNTDHFSKEVPGGAVVEQFGLKFLVTDLKGDPTQTLNSPPAFNRPRPK